MKTLTIAEALIALGNGEKVTSKYLDNRASDNYVAIYDSEAVEGFNGHKMSAVFLMKVLSSKNLRIYKEYIYPMWFKSKRNDAVLKFTGLKSAEVIVKGRLAYSVGYKDNNFIAHTDDNEFEQVEEPKKMISKELATEVLGYDVTNVSLQRGSNINITGATEKYTPATVGFNVHELLQKCLDWAKDEGYVIGVDLDKVNVWSIKNRRVENDFEVYNEDYMEFKFKACQWILDNEND